MLRQYPDLLQASAFLHAWKLPDTFPIDTISVQAKKQLQQIQGIEVVFAGTQGEEDRFDALLDTFFQYVTKTVFAFSMPAYLFICEPEMAIKSRLRSYKGIFYQSKLYRSPRTLEHEVDRADNLSIILGMIALSEDNISNALDFFLQSDRSFIISSTDEKVFTQAFLVTIAQSVLQFPYYAKINYLELVLRQCTQGDIIYRMGGDGGDQEISLQIFLHRDQTESVVQRLQIIV